MIRTLVRASALAAGAVVTLSALATPAAAEEVVPSGCVGSQVYLCTGEDGPPIGWRPVEQVPVTVTRPGTVLVPGTTVGGQQIGGVLVTLGGQTVPGASYETGPTSPVATGIVMPIDVCLFVTCIMEGTPVVVPSLPLPVVPVSIPSTTVPSEDVTVPVVGQVPTQTTPTLATPPVEQHVVTVAVYVDWSDLDNDIYELCRAGGGTYTIETTPRGNESRCAGGATAVVANALYQHFYTLFFLLS